MTYSSFGFRWTLLFIMIAIASCGTATNPELTEKKENIAVAQPIDTSLIAIIPFELSRNWVFDKTYTTATLNQKEIEEIESLLTTCVYEYNKKLSADNKQHFSINLTIEKYKRQYVPAMNNDGEKIVWINCLCNTYGDDWRTSEIMVDDGGKCYFNLKINLTKEIFYDFWVNGYALRNFSISRFTIYTPQTHPLRHLLFPRVCNNFPRPLQQLA